MVTTLMAWIVWFVHTPVGKGVVTGFGTAVAVDVHTFLSWKKVSDLTTWDWRTAFLRWGQGIVYGGAVGGGWGSLIG